MLVIPLTSIAHLLKLLHLQGDVAPIEAGQIITAGTITSAYPIKAGERWWTKLEGIALSDSS